MDSDFQQQQYQHHFQDPQRHFPHQKHQMNSLTRFRSAPSTCFATFLDTAANAVTHSHDGGEGNKGDFSNARPLSPETENIFAKFMSSMVGEANASTPQKLCDIPQTLAMQQTQFMVDVKQETETLQQQQQSNNSNSSQKVIYHSQSKPPLARHSNSGSAVSSAMENSFTAGSVSMGMDFVAPQIKFGDGQNPNNSSNSSGLTRYSSSPAGFFSNILDIDNGFGTMKATGSYGGGNAQMKFTSGQDSNSGLMRQNSDVETKVFNNSGNNNDSNYMSEYPTSSWDDSIMTKNFSSLGRAGGEDGRKTFSEVKASENQTGDLRNRPPLLSHHLSLPKMSADISAMEKILHFQDSVPCRIRAKRGCATHPRSIAERVRRTRISERMRKLEALVPNMDKQTNTADMLDLAVEYIKDLQKQIMILNDNRAKCTCS